jgi:hypothetical protein
MPKTTLHAGEPVVLAFVLINTPDHGILDGTIPNSTGGGVRAIRFTVSDAERKPVPETEYGSKAYRMPSGLLSGVVAYKIKPGTTSRGETDIAKEYDLRKPGKYTVQAERTEVETMRVVKSNVVEFTVTP